MTGQISSLLILAGGIVLIWGVFWLVYRIPLRFELSFYNNQTGCAFFLQIGWGPFSIRITRVGTGWQIMGNICHKTLISKPIKQGVNDTKPAGETSKTGEKFPIKDFIRFIPVIKHLLIELIRHISIDSLSMNITFGAGDPVTTGCTYGYYHALRPLITSDTCSITLTPDFDRIIIEGTGEGGVLITTPVGLFIRGARVILPEVLQMKRGIHA